MLEAYGVRHALLVGPNSGYGTDNRCLLNDLACHPARFKGIPVVDIDAPGSYLRELKAQGIVGAAFNFALHGMDYYSSAGPLLARLAALDMFVQVQAEASQLQVLSPMLIGSGAQLLIDHCGRPDVASDVTGKGFAALLRLVDSRRATVMISGFAKFSSQGFPFPDTRPYTAALLETFGADHCVWASDWPFLRAPQRLDYGTLLQLFGQMTPDANDGQKILWNTPMRLFGSAESNDTTRFNLTSLRCP